MNSDTALKRWLFLHRVEQIAALFLVLFGLLLLVNFMLTRNQDPLNSNVMQQLLNRLAENPQDEALREEVRNLDLLARKAFFTRQWQIRSGGLLLLIAAVIWLIAGKFKRSCTQQIADPALLGKIPETHNEKSARVLVACAVSFVFLSLLAGWSSYSALRFPPPTISQTPVIKEQPPEPQPEPPAAVVRQDTTATTREKKEPAPATVSTTPIRKSWPREKQWPAFRGPQFNGHAFYANAPLHWDGSNGKNIKWKSAVPLSGFNSPIVWGEQLFISGADATQREVYCYNTQNGNLLWRTAVPTNVAKMPQVAKDTGFAAATMTTDGERVFAIFASGDLACMDFSGKIVWSKGLGVPDNHYGHCSSLVSWQDLLYVQFDDARTGRVLALKTNDGSVVWDQSRQVQVSWTSPTLAQINNVMQLIVNANPLVAGYDARTGQELWSHESVSGEPAPSPTVSDNRVYVVNEYSRLAAIEIHPTVKLLWETDEDLAEVSSPLVADNLLFVATSGGTVTCRNAASGQKLWYQDFDRGFYASPLLCGDRIYLLDRDGLMHVFKCATQYESLAENPLGEPCNSTAAVMDGIMFLRSEKNLYCIVE